MEITMKPSIIIVALVVLAIPARAQQSHRRSPDTEGSQSFIMDGSGGGFGEIGHAGRGLHYEPPRDWKLIDVTNDGPFVPSSYMKYDDAVALGRQQLVSAEESAKNPAAGSLGDVARAHRIVKVTTSQIAGRAIQDNAGRIEVCSQAGNNCHLL